MDVILEQILFELKGIKQLLAESDGLNDADVIIKSQNKYENETMKTKEAAEYLGITEHRLRLLTKQGKIKYFTAGNRFLYKRKSLDLWLEEVQESSIKKAEEMDDYVRTR